MQSHDGKRRALSDAERLLLQQQDELRQLRSRSQMPQQQRQQLEQLEQQVEAEKAGDAKPSFSAPAPAPLAQDSYPMPPQASDRGAQSAATPTLPEPVLPKQPEVDPLAASRAREPARTQTEPQAAAVPSLGGGAKQEGGGGIGAAGNLFGIVLAGILGGLLYTSKQEKKVAAEDFKGQLAGRDKVIHPLCKAFIC